MMTGPPHGPQDPTDWTEAATAALAALEQARAMLYEALDVAEQAFTTLQVAHPFLTPEQAARFAVLRGELFGGGRR